MFGQYISHAVGGRLFQVIYGMEKDTWQIR